MCIVNGVSGSNFQHVCSSTISLLSTLGLLRLPPLPQNVVYAAGDSVRITNVHVHKYRSGTTTILPQYFAHDMTLFVYLIFLQYAEY